MGRSGVGSSTQMESQEQSTSSLSTSASGAERFKSIVKGQKFSVAAQLSAVNTKKRLAETHERRSKAVAIGGGGMFEATEQEVERTKRFLIRTQFLLMAFAVVIMVVAVACTWYIWNSATVNRVNELTQSIRRGTAEHVEESVLGRVLKQAEIATNIVSQATVPWMNPIHPDLAEDPAYVETDPYWDRLRPLVWGMLPPLLYLDGVYVAFPDDTFWGVFTDVRGELFFERRLPDDPNVERFKLSSDHADMLSFDPFIRRPYTPTERPWYITTEALGAASWTSPYVFSTDSSLGITYTYPVYDESVPGTKTLMFMVSADIKLSLLSDYLKFTSISNTVSMILDEQFLLVGGSWSDLALSKGSYLNQTRLSPKDSGFSVVAEIGDWLDDEFDGIEDFIHEVAEGEQFEVSTSSGVVMVDVELFHGEFESTLNQSWFLLLLTFRDVYLGSVDRGGVITLVVTIIVGLVSLIFMVAFTHVMMRPLLTLGEEMRKLGMLDFGYDVNGEERRSLKQTRIKEIRAMNKSFSMMKRTVHSFAKFIPSSIVNTMVKQGKMARLGAEEKNLSIYFSDIVNYSTVSEKLPPDELVMLMAEYLDEMSDVIVMTGGTVDKYIGDAVMAFWNAPDDVEDHPKKACVAALACQARLEKLRPTWDERGLFPLRCRIGLHTDDVIVGNLGSHKRLSYTLIGDGVNLASRLEAICKQYGIETSLSESMYELVNDEFLCRPLDVVAVKGKTQGTKIFELVGHNSQVTDEQIRDCKDMTRALDLFLGREFRKASVALKNILVLRPGDKAVIRLLERCEKFVKHPPGPEWNGVEVMTEK